MTSKDLCGRTAAFAEAVVNLTDPLIDRLASREFALQLRSAAASVAGNYEAAQRAKSHRDFTSKLTTVLEESAESLFWLKFLLRCRMLTDQLAAPLIREADELVRIFQTAVRTARERDRADERPRRPNRRGSVDGEDPWR